MDWTDRKEAINGFIKKFRWAFVVLLTGLFLMGMPKTSEDPQTVLVEQETGSEEKTLQEQLEELSKTWDAQMYWAALSSSAVSSM